MRECINAGMVKKCMNVGMLKCVNDKQTSERSHVYRKNDDVH
jgi:hypothetical protein